MSRLRRRAMESLSQQIAAHDRARREKQSTVDESTLTEAERQFCVLADSRGKQVFRSGWPDFFVLDKDTDGIVFVEVKTGTDLVHASQARMFAALEAAGLRVCVWRPEEPLVLAPWRRFLPRQHQAAVPHGVVHRHHVYRSVPPASDMKESADPSSEDCVDQLPNHGVEVTT